MEKWLIPGLEQEICKTSLKYPVVPESKKVLEKQTHIDGCIEGVQESSESTPKGQRQNNLGNKIK